MKRMKRLVSNFLRHTIETITEKISCSVPVLKTNLVVALIFGVIGMFYKKKI